MKKDIQFTTINKVFLLLICCCSFALPAQEATIAQEDVQKIVKHLQTNYEIPTEVYYDSIGKINYNIHFVINEEGKVTEPKIISKNTECIACECELFRVLELTPIITPVSIKGRKVKFQYQLPFSILLQ